MAVDSSPFRYEKLEIWKRSMDLWVQLHRLTDQFPREEAYGLTSQIRRASCSVPANIAEGYGKGTALAFAASVRHARGSVYELRTLLEGARRLGYIEEGPAGEFLRELSEISRMIDAFLRKLHTTEVRETQENYVPQKVPSANCQPPMLPTSP